MLKKIPFSMVAFVVTLIAANGNANGQYPTMNSRHSSVSREAEQKVDYNYKYPCELLHDYHWNIESGKTLRYYEENAEALKVLLNRLSAPLTKRAMSGAGLFPKELRNSPVFNMSLAEWDAFATIFWAKYNETFAPHFKRFVYDETLSPEESDIALEL